MIYDNIPFDQQESIKKSTVPNHPPSRYLSMISIQKWDDSQESLCGWECQKRLLEPVFEFWRVKGIILAVGFLGKNLRKWLCWLHNLIFFNFFFLDFQFIKWIVINLNWRTFFLWKETRDLSALFGNIVAIMYARNSLIMLCTYSRYWQD